jgi:hypothetical protein
LLDGPFEALMKNYARTWIGEKSGSTRSSRSSQAYSFASSGNSAHDIAPLFRHEWWSVHERQTSAYSEADNRRMALLMGVKRPGLWTFIIRLRDAYDYYEQRMIEQLVDAESRWESTRRRTIQAAQSNFGKVEPLTYLYGIVRATAK